jgi:HK97 gp10 family phage protein
MKYQSLLPEARAKIDQFAFDVVDAVVKNTERVVKVGFLDFPKPPIETGNLRKSITGKVIKQTANEVIGEIRAGGFVLIDSKGKKHGATKKDKAEISYAKFVEYGTAKMPPRPFMRQGIAKAQKTNELIINRLIKRTYSKP